LRLRGSAYLLMIPILGLAVAPVAGQEPSPADNGSSVTVAARDPAPREPRAFDPGLPACSSDIQASAIADLESRLRQLEQRLAESEQQISKLNAALTPPANLPSADTAGPVAAPPPPTMTEGESSPPGAVPQASENTPATEETRLPFSGYMDFHFNKPRDGDPQLDFHRFVLLFGHSFSDRVKFWSELELEHALVEGLEEKGELELEQAYLDFLIRPAVNLRAGMLLAPVGLINERHEPPSFYGVERPFVDTVIIPTTWFDTGAGLFGDLGRGFTYKAYAMAPLDATGFSADEGIREGRQQGFQSIVRNVAWTGRLEYHGAPGLALGASVWRGEAGFNVPRVDPRVTVWDVDGRFTFERLDFRGQYAEVGISRAGDLNAALQASTGVNPNIARTLRGFYVEPAIRVLPATFPHDLALFVRYENFDTQWRMPAGYLPLPEFDREAWVFGASYYPDPDIAVKVDYSWLRNRSAVVRAPRSFNVGFGWWF
jgi:hypothetical protein